MNGRVYLSYGIELLWNHVCHKNLKILSFYMQRCYKRHNMALQSILTTCVLLILIHGVIQNV